MMIGKIWVFFPSVIYTHIPVDIFPVTFVPAKLFYTSDFFPLEINILI